MGPIRFDDQEFRAQAHGEASAPLTQRRETEPPATADAPREEDDERPETD